MAVPNRGPLSYAIPKMNANSGSSAISRSAHLTSVLNPFRVCCELFSATLAAGLLTGRMWIGAGWKRRFDGWQAIVEGTAMWVQTMDRVEEAGGGGGGGAKGSSGRHGDNLTRGRRSVCARGDLAGAAIRWILRPDREECGGGDPCLRSA